ncbi:MAG: hypothetical protein R6W78_07115 [Bacteroidales bacterium]
MKNISVFVSYLFHPVFIPLVGIFIIMNSGTYASLADKEVLKILYLIAGTFTILLPVGLLPLYLFTGIIRNIHIDEHRRRIIPYFITFVLLYTTYILIKKLPLSAFVTSFMFASAMTVLLLLIISYFWKISSHMAGAGGLTGLIMCLSMMLSADLMYYLIVALMLGGILASARLYLDAHNGTQVFLGFLLGLVTVFSICVIYA